jgi:hypothetical protein
VVVPGFDLDLFAKYSLFLLCYTLSFIETIKRYIEAALKEYLIIKKGLTGKLICFDVSIISGDMFLHLSQNLPVIREVFECL